MTTATLAKAPAAKAPTRKRAPAKPKPAAQKITTANPGLPARSQHKHIRDTELGDAFNLFSAYSGATEAQITGMLSYSAMSNIAHMYPAIPRLVLTAATHSCGKSTNGQLVAAFGHRPEIMGAQCSTPAFFGTLLAEPGALLFFDELEKTLGQDGAQKNGEKANSFRAVYNDGYTPEGFVRKMSGNKVVKIPVCSPLITAGNGKYLQNDSLSRALIVNLPQVKPAQIYVAPRHKPMLIAVGKEFREHMMTTRAEAFFSERALTDADDVGSDDGRWQLIMSPIVSVMDFFGYGLQGRAAIREILTGLAEDPVRPMHEWLLLDVRDVWADSQRRLTGVDIIKRLHKHPAARWTKELPADPSGAMRLGGMLAKVGIESSVQHEPGQANGKYFQRADIFRSAGSVTGK